MNKKAQIDPHHIVNTRHNIKIAYDCFGQQQCPCVILVMGLGAQMRVWPDAFCHGLANLGFYVIRYDNRDAGASSHFEHAGKPNIAKAWLSTKLRQAANIPYTLDDMAQDLIDLIEALKLHSAHIVGASMGAMIGQIAAAQYPTKIRSLTSIMSAAQPPTLRPKWRILFKIMRRPACKNEHVAVRYTMMMNDVIGSPGFPMDNDEVLKLAQVNYARTSSRNGVLRQLAAITSSGDRRQQLQKIQAPTLVIHGQDDPLIPIEMGQCIAQQVKGSQFHKIPGMGHNLPQRLVPHLLKLVGGHVQQAEKRWQSLSSDTNDTDQ